MAIPDVYNSKLRNIVDEVSGVNGSLLYFSCNENLTKIPKTIDVSNLQHDEAKEEIRLESSASNLVGVNSPTITKIRDVSCDTNGGLVYFSCSENFTKTPNLSNVIDKRHCVTQTDDVSGSTPPKSKSIVSSLKSKFIKSSSITDHPEDFINGYEFINQIPTQQFMYAEPQIITWIKGTYLPTTSIRICVVMQDKLDNCHLKKFTSIKGFKLKNFYLKSINAVTKVYKIEGNFVIVITHQAKTDCSDLIYSLTSISSYLQQRKDELFTITLDVSSHANKIKPVLDYTTNCSYSNIKWILDIPFNMEPQYGRVLSSRWIIGDPTKFLNSKPIGELPSATPSFYKDTSAEYYYKNAIIEIMFYMKHSNGLIKNHLYEYYRKHIHLLPYAASSLRSIHIFIFDNHCNRYLEEPINKHQFGFDGENLVQFCEDTLSFLTPHRFIFCSSGTEVMLDHLIYNHLINIYNMENIKIPILTTVQGVPGCGKSTWIINNHNLGRDLVLCATKEGLADLKLKVTSRCADEKLDFNKMRGNYKTIASYLVNGSRSYDTVFIDEFMMVHAGYIGLVAMLSKCSKIFLLGDKNQIPYIDRLHHVNMQFTDPNKFTSNFELLNVTYRCPVDVAFALTEFYPNISSKNPVKSSVEYFKLPPSLSMLPMLDNTFYLTFTKADKQLLTSQLTVPSSSKVMTIHEAQGLTSPNVICVRTNPNPLELFDSIPHAIVAISRHTRSFKYISPVEADRLHSLVAKARSLARTNATDISSTGVLCGKTTNQSLKTDISSTGVPQKPCGRITKQPLSEIYTIYYQNVNKMASKASIFYNFVLKTNYLIYVISETSLNPGIRSTEYFGQNYIVYRCDRSAASSSKKSGGGVLIAVHTSICNSPITLTPSIVEEICVKISINKKNLYIYTAYIPPQSSCEIYARCSESIDELINTTNSLDLVLVIGDFNLPNVMWKFDHEMNCILPFNISSETEWLFIDAMLGSNLNQINNIANNREHFLDLFFTNEMDIFKVAESLTPFVVNDINHKAMEIVFNSTDFIPRRSRYQQQTSYNFHKANHIGLKLYLDAINWDEIFNAKDVNVNVNKFYEILIRGCETHVPVCNIETKIHPPWFDDRLINLKNRKSKAYARMLKSSSEPDKLTFLQYSDEFDSYFKIKYGWYVTGIQEKIKGNPKQFWKYFRTKREIVGYPTNMSYNNTNTSDEKDIADMFAEFFQSVYRPKANLPKDNNVNPEQLTNNNLLFVPPVITAENILSVLKDFNDGCGPDRIPSSFLKLYADHLVKPLRDLFNLSLRSGVFPDKWKISKITPIFKSGKRDDITCYRGISTTSSIPKLFELVVCNSFKFTLSRHISFTQHGFMPGRSTSTNLVEFTSKVINDIEKHHQVDVVYTDFSKAFDSICHQKALESLYAFGFSFNFVKWINSYLTNRMQYVVIGNKMSKDIRVTSGVPQGSHIGPWIFLVFIDQITEIIKNSNVLIFADDIKIFHTIKDICDTESLQEDLNRLTKWCDLNTLQLNIKKCKVMSFHRKQNPIHKVYNINNCKLQRVHEIIDLGVTFTVNVTFNRHIDNCIAKANSMFGFVKRWTSEFKDIPTLLTLYFAYVRSQVEYAATVWSPYYAVHNKRIESIQKKFLLFLLKKTNWDYDDSVPFYENVARLPPYTTRCQNYKICTLENRRCLLDAAFIGNVLLGHIDSPFILENISVHVPGRLLRHNRFLNLEQHSTNYGDNNPMNRLAKSFNTVEHLFDFNLSKDSFKKNLKNYFLN